MGIILANHENWPTQYIILKNNVKSSKTKKL